MYSRLRLHGSSSSLPAAGCRPSGFYAAGGGLDGSFRGHEVKIQSDCAQGSSGLAQENYGPFTIYQPARSAGSRGPADAVADLQGEIPKPSTTVPAAWLTGYFHACPAVAALTPCGRDNKQDPPPRGRQSLVPCRSFRPTVSLALAQRCCGPPARRRKKRTQSLLAVSTPISPVTIPRRDRDPDLYRPHQGRPYRTRRDMDHRQESPTTTVIDGHWGFGFMSKPTSARCG